ncbi:hypothetical protein ACFPRL_08805 [Pseudoclavibacter helvolus]
MRVRGRLRQRLVPARRRGRAPRWHRIRGPRRLAWAHSLQHAARRDRRLLPVGDSVRAAALGPWRGAADAHDTRRPRQSARIRLARRRHPFDSTARAHPPRGAPVLRGDRLIPRLDACAAVGRAEPPRRRLASDGGPAWPPRGARQRDLHRNGGQRRRRPPRRSLRGHRARLAQLAPRPRQHRIEGREACARALPRPRHRRACPRRRAAHNRRRLRGLHDHRRPARRRTRADHAAVRPADPHEPARRLPRVLEARPRHGALRRDRPPRRRPHPSRNARELFRQGLADRRPAGVDGRNGQLQPVGSGRAEQPVRNVVVRSSARRDRPRIL